LLATSGKTASKASSALLARPRSLRLTIPWDPDTVTLEALVEEVQSQASLLFMPEPLVTNRIKYEVLLLGPLQVRGGTDKRPQPFSVVMTDQALRLQISKPGGVSALSFSVCTVTNT
jgi:hypothetical protein